MSKVPKEDQCVCARDDAAPKAIANEGSATRVGSGGGGQEESGDCQPEARTREEQE